MSSSYDRNIDRLKSAERRNAQTAMSQRTSMAQIEGQRGIEEADKIGRELEKFWDDTWKDEEGMTFEEATEYYGFYIEKIVLNKPFEIN